ncbi:hypothetical protein [Streptomyces sp. NPDC095613]|uniref:hypothetical protein n=1 Tax=Streptomyces sp. NPDC095613 TaxID=3155540 RepID=UPI00332001E3
MTSAEDKPRVGRRSLLAGAAGLGTAAALHAPAATAAAAAQVAPAKAAPRPRYPSNWPDPEPYGLADTRRDHGRTSTE